MAVPDLLNGCFEFCGSLLICVNVAALYRDKCFPACAWVPAFFFLWGLWNLFYYPHLGQWLSFTGGCGIVVANGVWAAQMVYYGRNHGNRGT